MTQAEDIGMRDVGRGECDESGKKRVTDERGEGKRRRDGRQAREETGGRSLVDGGEVKERERENRGNRERGV